MDFPISNLTRTRRFPRPEDGLRAMAENAPRAEALATSWIGIVRPFFARLYALRRRVATVTVGLLAGVLLVHVMFGANGMVVYKKKRAEYESLQKRIIREQKENEIYAQRIQALQADERAIEKEAREQLHYARPGELVYVPPTVPANPGPAMSHSAKK
ncbi:MAG: septum formation initiator family protein [Candidatus Sulfotelmatobacter sp.]